VPAWDRDWGGDFTVWNDADEIVRSVAIKPNRLVIFDGNPLHAARPLSRFAQDRRVVVAFGREVME
jgi:Rps23 Pro-64 3,4-dihydroxylase Tpa1-like proline 4-hydroxylase